MVYLVYILSVWFTSRIDSLSGEITGSVMMLSTASLTDDTDSSSVAEYGSPSAALSLSSRV